MVAADLLVEVTRLAREAGRATMAYYNGAIPAAVRLKEDSSPVTLADEEAHAILLEGLARLDPETPVISEEAEAPPFQVRRAWPRFWLVDPLDGTKEFIKRRAEFTVNVALIQGGEPVLGVIVAPALNLVYWAAKGSGSWRQENSSEPERIYSRERTPGTPLTVVESLSHPSQELEEYLRDLPVGRRVKAGSSLKFCWVADGRADIYPRLGPTMEWDVAAGDCIYRQSARQGERTSPLVYNKPELRNPSFVIGG